MTDKIKIVIIDDDIGIIDCIKSILSSKYNIEGCTSSKEGLARVKQEKFDLLILDYFIDEMNGESIVKSIREFNKDLYIMLLTGFKDNIPGIKSLESIDIQSYCEKGSEVESIIISIESAIKSIKFFRNINKVSEESFKDRLKFLRAKNKISQGTLAEYLGVNRSTVASYEIGNSEPSFEILKKIATYFSISIDYLLGNSFLK